MTRPHLKKARGRARAPLTWLVAATLSALGQQACAGGSGTQRATVAPEPRVSGPAEATSPPGGDVTPGDGASQLASRCAPASETDQDDACDALDSDCDGRIDEGCEYRSGALQITLAWDAEVDLDLYVSEPGGDPIYFNRAFRRSSGGGHMDQDARGQCRPEQTHTRVENVYWSGAPPIGEYTAEIHYFSPCGERDGAVTATLSVALSGRVLGSFAYRVAPEQRIQALSFRVGAEGPNPTR